MTDVGRSMKIRAAASIAFSTGTPSFVSQSGDFVATITDTGTGNIALTLLPGCGIDATEVFVVCTPRTTLAASQLTTIGCTHTSDTVKTFTILQEGAAGAVSALADVNFDVVFVSFGD